MLGASTASAGIGLRVRRWILTMAVGLTAGVVSGCPLELERDVSCGDGWWDPEFEECDPRDTSHLNACRAKGWDKDAVCDPVTCELRATEEDCARCGDGVASHTEECDGQDLRGTTCSAGVGLPTCKSDCTLDHTNCPPVCGDDVVSGVEECEPTASCAVDDDCPLGTVCYQAFGQCVAVGENFAPNLACGAYNNKAIGVDKPYTSGTIDRCTSECFFGRNDCGFCGDGVLDPEYKDLVFPSGELTEFPSEKCDGQQVADQQLLINYCAPLCPSDSPINGDVEVLCDFECNAGCSGFAPPDDIAPGPDAFGCCLAKGSPCPKFDTEGVPDFPCCSWLENPNWLAEEKCVIQQTGAIPVVFVCP
ncbi:hypothetical protein [Enhygromyxa salina]|nr:hypothetical protein [Enhygromyxa salina]